MESYTRRFNKFLVEQDEELSDLEAMESDLDTLSPDDLGTSAPPSAATAVAAQEKEMFNELKGWIDEMDRFAEFLNGTENSIQTRLNMADADTLFDSISNGATKKIATVAKEVSSLSEELKGYLASSNNPKYRYV